MPDCSHCGSHNEEGAASCHSCGALFADATASFEPVSAGDVESPLAAPFDEGPLLVVRKGPQPGERFYLDRPRLTVGRDPESDIFLNDMTVSRAHAVLSLVDDRVTVADAGSLNGTYLNGACVDEARLSEGDVLQVGTFQMVFHAGAEDR